MKYTRDESNAVIEVKGCTTCPHKENRYVEGKPFMYCLKPLAGTVKTAGRKLTSHWTGQYHASCPLAISPDNVPALEKKK